MPKPDWCTKESPCDYDKNTDYCPHRECMQNRNTKKECEFCKSKTKLCKGSGQATVGRCHWVALLQGLRDVKHTLEHGQFVDRPHRGVEQIEKLLEKYDR